MTAPSETEARTALAAHLLLTTRPSDRALAGWEMGPGEDEEALDVMNEYAAAAARTGRNPAWH